MSKRKANLLMCATLPGMHDEAARELNYVLKLMDTFEVMSLDDSHNPLVCEIFTKNSAGIYVPYDGGVISRSGSGSSFPPSQKTG